MRRRLGLGLLVTLTACSLFTSLEDLSRPSPVVIIVSPEAGPPEAGPPEAGPSAEAGGADAAGSDVDPRSAAYANAVLSDRPISYWRFEETSGATAKDETGAHHGVYVGDPSRGEAGIAGGRAIALANESHVEVATTAFRYAGNASFTMELWVKPGQPADLAWLLSTERGDQPRSGWSLLGSGTAGFYEVWGTQGGPATTDSIQSRSARVTDALTAGVFHHVVVTYDGRVAVTYFDGTESSSYLFAEPAPNTGDALMMGCASLLDGTDFTYCLEGWTIDEVALYDHPLAAARVQDHYARGVASAKP